MHPNISGWIKKVSTGSRDDCFYFRCKVCMGGKLALSNMGVRSVISHMTDKTGKIFKHNKNMASIEGSKKGLFTAAVPTAPVPAPVEGNSTGSSIVDTGVQKKIRLDTASEEVVISWILWGLDIVQSHHSLNSSANKGKLFMRMFKNHPIAQSFGK